MGKNYRGLSVGAPRSEQREQSKARNKTKAMDRDTRKSFRIEEVKEDSCKLKAEIVFPQITKFRKC